MRNLTDFAIRHEHKRIKELGDRLVEIGNRINWDDFRPNPDILLCNNTDHDGRHTYLCYRDVYVFIHSAALQPFR